MFGLTLLLYKIIEFWNKPIVKEYRAWFVRNSKIIALMPILFLSLDNMNKDRLIAGYEEERKEITEQNLILRQRSLNVFRVMDDMKVVIAWSKLKVEKEIDFIMLRNNSVYYEKILKSLGLDRNAYIGQRDSDIWPKHIVNKWRPEDSLVAFTGKDYYTTDSIPDSLGRYHEYLIVKFRKLEHRDTLVLGIGLELEPILKELRKHDKDN